MNTPISSWATSSWAYALYSTLAIIAIYCFTHRPVSSNVTVDGLCHVISVIDGDSLIVQCGTQQHNLRLMHIDAPEINQPHWGQLAKQALTQLAKQRVLVEFHGNDVYQRNLALIFSPHDNQNSINLKLVEQGAVRVYSRYNPPTDYLTTMKAAKTAKRGIWQANGLHQDPMRYRRLAH